MSLWRLFRMRSPCFKTIFAREGAVRSEQSRESSLMAQKAREGLPPKENAGTPAGIPASVFPSSCRKIRDR